jgi:hypothetical protein
VVHDLLAGTGVGGDATGLRDVADAAPHLLGLLDHVEPGHRGGALGGTQQGGEHPERGGLAGAVRAEESDDLTLGDVEVDAVDGADLLLLLAVLGVEGLHESPCMNHRFACGHGGTLPNRNRCGQSF